MIYVSVCSGRVPHARGAAARNCTHMACAWFVRPTKEPFPAPDVVCGGTSTEAAKLRAVELSRQAGRDGDVEDIGPAWARAHRFRMRGEPAWPEQRAAAKAAEQLRHAAWQARWARIEAEQRTAAPFAHLSDEELQARLRAAPRAASWTTQDEPITEAEHLLAEMMARGREAHRRFVDGAAFATSTAFVVGVNALSALDLAPGATAEEVRRAFRRLALTAHPDRGGTTEAFVALVKARDEALAAIGSP